MGNAFEFRGGLLARNTIWNFIGQSLPFLVAVFTIPRLIEGLGTDRFGVLNLAWIVVGYFSLFDLGLGRALTKLVAEKLAAGKQQEIVPLAWTSLFLMVVLGAVGTVVLALLCPWLVHTALKTPKGLQSETLHAFYLLALSLPVITSSAGFAGILAALQRFRLINAIGIPMAIITYAGPLLVFPFSRNLFPVVAVLVAGRLVAWLANLLGCLYVMPELRRGIALKLEVVKPLISFGAWMTVSNIVGPIMGNLDRFLISAMVSVSAVAYYATPYTMVTRLWIIPVALVGVLFPAFSASFVQNRDRTAQLFARGVRYTFLGLFPIILLIVTLAHEGLSVWLGAEFAQHSTRVLQWLAVGAFINSLGQIPFALVQGAGRPDITAKFHLVELPLYLLALKWMIIAHGIEGAAIAWVARVSLDSLLLFGMTQRLLPSSGLAIRRVGVIVGLALVIFALASLNLDLVMKALFLLLTLPAFALAGWFLILTLQERSLICRELKITQKAYPLRSASHHI